MGRKPNQLILEFFNRGPKLEDASNRYQHTCKACGEKFPKGRIDSLTNHLVKKCQAIPLRDRQRVLLRLHELPDLADHDASQDSNPSGVNAAEASRRVGAGDQSKRGPGYAQSVTVGGKTVVVDPALEAEGLPDQDAAAPDNEGNDPKANATPQSPNASALPPNQSPAVPDQPDQPPSTSPLSPNATLTVDSPGPNARQSSQLSLIAASASEMVPQGVVTDQEVGSVGSNGVTREATAATWPSQQLSSSDQLLLDSLQEHDPSLTSSTQRAAAFPRPIAMNPNSQTKGFVNDFGDATKPTKPKVRGRFSATRRREVQEVRKRGACIRCRMLKKPCSGDSPCSTCSSVESARLWKQPCIRTRLVEEFELYSAGLHTTLTFHDINSAKNQVHFEHYAGRLEATHFEESSVYVTFSALVGHKPTVTALDPQLQELAEDGQFQTATQEVYVLDGDMDDLPGKLEMYIKKMASVFYDRERSDFIKPTLGIAAELSLQKSDILLERVLELWLATHILVDTELQWQTFANSTLPPTSINTLATSSDESRMSIDNTTNPESYALLCSQLRAAAEKRTSQLSKSVMNDLERRLLQRQQSGRFETFLVALILLSCVERTCWLFQTWDNESYAGRWPLDKRPPYYAGQGERFSDILFMILKMRGLPPKTSPRHDTGILKAAKEETDENVARWFDAIKITSQHLDERQNAEFNPDDSRSLELKYGSKLLQPAVHYS